MVDNLEVGRIAEYIRGTGRDVEVLSKDCFEFPHWKSFRMAPNADILIETTETLRETGHYQEFVHGLIRNASGMEFLKKTTGQGLRLPTQRLTISDRTVLELFTVFMYGVIISICVFFVEIVTVECFYVVFRGLINQILDLRG